MRLIRNSAAIANRSKLESVNIGLYVSLRLD
jgi:hypothetical protein